MTDPITPQPWWAAAIGGVLFTIRWLIGFGARSSSQTIKSLIAENRRLSDRIEQLEERQRRAEQQIEELQVENDRLRKQMGPILPGFDY